MMLSKSFSDSAPFLGSRDKLFAHHQIASGQGKTYF